MKKFVKIVAVVVGVLAVLAMAGCGGDDKKKKEEPPKPPVATTEKKEEPKVEKKVKPVAKSPLYQYALHVDDEKKVPPMTPEIIAEFEKQAKPIKIAPKDAGKGRHGIWVFSSTKTPGAQVNTYRWTAELDGHHDTQFKNDKGKLINEQHYCHIDMTTNAKDNKLRTVKVHKYHVTKDIGEKGKSEEIYSKNYME